MFHNLFQQLFTSLRGRESPISYVQKIVEKTPDSRFDIRFQSQFEDYKRIKHLLVLNNQERIVLDMILQGETYEKMEELVKGLENPLIIKDREVKRLLRRLVSLDRKVESLSSGVSNDDDVPPSSDILDVD